MDLVTIGLGILVLATLVAAFLASKRWHWAHVLVVVGIVFASLGYVVLLTPAMKTRIKWQKAYKVAEEGLEAKTPLLAAIQRGTDDLTILGKLEGLGVEVDEEQEEIEGVRTLQERVRVDNQLRGRMWTQAELSGVDDRTGEVQLSIESPSPLGIDDGALLFAFEQGAPAPNAPEDGAQYIGEFRVVELGEQSVTLQPVVELDDRELDRIASSRGPWILHETMPVDDPSLFSGMTDDELQALIPADVAAEYLRQGTNWTTDDGEETKLGFDKDDVAVGPADWGKAVRFEYRRQLRDYSASFQELARQQTELLADIQAIEQDNAKLGAALKGAQELSAYRTETGRKLRHDLDGHKKEQQAIEAHLAALQRQVEKAESLLTQTMAANTMMAAELTAMQQAFAGRDLRSDPVRSRRAVDVDAL